MIHPDSRSLPWIQEVADKYRFKEVQLIEKTIRAFSLLEALVRSGCPFVFKGGTSLMLHLNSSKRLSIDIDIICPPGTDIEKYLGMYAEEYGFGNIQLVERVSRTDVPKKHAKFFYQVSFFAGRKEEKILLDVLFEEIHYNEVVTLPIESPLLMTEGEPIMVNLPSYQDLLGDKLTAFAPHTTGIPFFKGEKVVHHQARKYGKTKFGINRFVNGYLDLITLWFLSKFGVKPMHIFGFLGSIMFFLGFIAVIAVGAMKIYNMHAGNPYSLVTDNPYFFLALTTMILGTQLFIAGFLGELVARNSQERNKYQIEKEL